MPYICLARTDIPDGTIQILDLKPNTSQRTVYDPPGQTKYVNRAQNVVPKSDSLTGLSITPAQGVAAYLADRVAVGGTVAATGTFTFAAVANPGHTVSIKGVPFFNVALGLPPNPALQQFDGSSGDNAAAASLALAINDPATQALLLAALPAGVTVTAVNVPATPLVTLTASVTGAVGDTVTLTSTGATILVGAMARAGATAWTAATLTARAAALIARMDAGQALALADVDAILGAVGGTLTTGGSTGILAELLSIMAGRGYDLPIGSAKFVGGVWDPKVLGSFTHTVMLHGTTMADGEIKASAPVYPAVMPISAGVAAQYENKPTRHTYDGTEFQVSLATGHLATFAAGVTLFPDSDLAPYHPSLMQPGHHYAQVNARVVTVYDDDGSLLA